MTPEERELLSRYVGGQLEVQNQIENYLYRGEIKKLAVNDKGDLVIEFAWWAKAVDAAGNPLPPRTDLHLGTLSQVEATGYWASEDNLNYSLTVEISGDEPDDPAIPACTVTEIGEGRTVLRPFYVTELLLFFPKGKGGLDKSKVRGL